MCAFVKMTKKEMERGVYPIDPEIEAKYQAFISKIPEYIALIKIFLDKERLDYSPKEVDQIQKFYKKNYKKLKEPKLFLIKILQWFSPVDRKLSEQNLTYDEFKNCKAAYLGTAHLYYFGGAWSWQKHKIAHNYGQIEIIDWGDENIGIPISPFDWVEMVEENVWKNETLGDMFKSRVELIENGYIKNVKPVRNLY